MNSDEILQRVRLAGKELVLPALHWVKQLYTIKKDQQQQRIHEIELEKRKHSSKALDALTAALIRHNAHLAPPSLGAPYVQHINAISEQNLRLTEQKQDDE